MGLRYSTQIISGYNASPPTDDNQQIPANLADWNKHKTKIGDPIKILSDNVTAKFKEHVNIGSKIVNVDSGYTIITSDYGKVLEIERDLLATVKTITMGVMATLGSGFYVTLHHSGTYGDIILSGNGTETIEGDNLWTGKLTPGSSITLMSNETNTDWVIIDRSNNVTDVSIAYISSDIAMTSASSIPVDFDTNIYDPKKRFDRTSDIAVTAFNQYIIPATGFYRFDVKIHWINIVAGDTLLANLNNIPSSQDMFNSVIASGVEQIQQFSFQGYFSTTHAAMEILCLNSTRTTSSIKGGIANSYISVKYLGNTQ